MKTDKDLEIYRDDLVELVKRFQMMSQSQNSALTQPETMSLEEGFESGMFQALVGDHEASAECCSRELRSFPEHPQRTAPVGVR